MIDKKQNKIYMYNIYLFIYFEFMCYRYLVELNMSATNQMENSIYLSLIYGTTIFFKCHACVTGPNIFSNNWHIT